MKKSIFIITLLLLVLAGCGDEETIKEIEPIEVVEESAAEKEEREIIEAAEKREATEVRELLEVKPSIIHSVKISKQVDIISPCKD